MNSPTAGSTITITQDVRGALAAGGISDYQEEQLQAVIDSGLWTPPATAYRVVGRSDILPAYNTVTAGSTATVLATKVDGDEVFVSRWVAVREIEGETVVILSGVALFEEHYAVRTGV